MQGMFAPDCDAYVAGALSESVLHGRSAGAARQQASGSAQSLYFDTQSVYSSLRSGMGGLVSGMQALGASMQPSISPPGAKVAALAL